MTDIVTLCTLFADLEVTEVERWIGEAWVLPENAGGTYVFHEVDIARVRLIVELRHDMSIDDEAMPVVLNLLDQVYALRRRLKQVTAALDTLPPDLRTAIAARLGEAKGE